MTSSVAQTPPRCPTCDKLIAPDPAKLFSLGELLDSYCFCKNAPATATTAGEPTDEIIAFLRNEAEECMKSVMARRTQPGDRDKTEAELKTAKRLAEKMTGRKMDLVSTKPEDNRAYCDMQDRIAAKQDEKARKLYGWADYLERAGSAHPDPKDK